MFQHMVAQDGVKGAVRVWDIGDVYFFHDPLLVEVSCEVPDVFVFPYDMFQRGFRRKVKKSCRIGEEPGFLLQEQIKQTDPVRGVAHGTQGGTHPGPDDLLLPDDVKVESQFFLDTGS